MQNIEWYHSLNLPALHPPDWIFVPVWTIIYILMLSSLIIYLTQKLTFKQKLPGILIFIVQLVLNILWSPVFFYNQNPEGALIICFILVFAVILNIGEFHRRSRLAAYLLIPYLLWSIFALYLNIEIVRLN